jgi:K+-transporting ATPase KdpF subunit
MNVIYIVGSIVSALLLAYPIFALLKPEWFS